MKKLLLLLTLVSLFSCDELDELTKFDLDYETSFTIEVPEDIDVPIEISTPTVTTNSEFEFENNDTRSDLIESITLKSLVISIDEPQSGNFDFLNEIRVSIIAEGLPELEIAYLENITEENLSELVLEVVDEDLKEYLKVDSYTFEITTIMNAFIQEDHTIAINSIFSVDAEIFGL